MQNNNYGFHFKCLYPQYKNMTDLLQASFYEEMWYDPNPSEVNG